MIKLWKIKIEKEWFRKPRSQAEAFSWQDGRGQKIGERTGKKRGGDCKKGEQKERKEI